MIEFGASFPPVAFGMYGTLSKTAEILHVSQPTLTRNMKLFGKGIWCHSICAVKKSHCPQ